jgi:uncharacterized MnhB-related membrane protein
MGIIDIVQIAVGAAMVVLAVIAINAKKKITSVILLSAVSMLAVIAFVIMRAPDVAITEAVIGSGLVTALFVFTLFYRKKEGEDA